MLNGPSPAADAQRLQSSGLHFTPCPTFCLHEFWRLVLHGSLKVEGRELGIPRLQMRGIEAFVLEMYVEPK